jgi:hypothetical protein
MSTITLEWLQHNLACREGINFAVRNKLIGFPFELLPAVRGNYSNFIEWIYENKSNIITIENGKLHSLTKPDYSYCVIFEYDSNNNIIHRIISGNSLYKEYWYEYDENNKPIRDLQGSHKQTVILTYEYGKNTKRTYTPTGEENLFLYDDLGRLICKNNNHHYEYDSNNNLIYEIDKYGLESWYEYDENNNIIYEKGYRKRYHQNYNSYEKGEKRECWYRYDVNNNKIYTKVNDTYEKTIITDFYENGQLKRIETLYLPNFSLDNNEQSEFYTNTVG